MNLDGNNLNRYSVISQKPEIINFVQELIGDADLFTHSEITRVVFAVSTVVFIDVSGISEEDFGIIRQFATKILLISPIKGGSPLTNLNIKGMKFLIPYPCSKEIAKTYLNNFLYMINKTYGNEINNAETKVYSKEIEQLSEVLGVSAVANDIKQKMVECAKTDYPVLLLGETGSGKTTSAQIIHKISKRKNEPFMHINISTIGDTLADSVLFGAEQGAYTDAQKKEGLFKQASGGTLFIDEIGTASLSMQAKFLTIMDTGQFYSVGSAVPQKVDVRLLFATNENLKQKVAEGTFRKDLYYRMMGNFIYFASLRERKEDIPVIAARIAKENGKTLSENSIRKISEYDWPGNIRQLIFTIARACSKDKQIIEPDDIEFEI